MAVVDGALGREADADPDLVLGATVLVPAGEVHVQDDGSSAGPPAIHVQKRLSLFFDNVASFKKRSVICTLRCWCLKPAGDC